MDEEADLREAAGVEEVAEEEEAKAEARAEAASEVKQAAILPLVLLRLAELFCIYKL